MSEAKGDKRYIQYDILRILSAFSVIMLHSSAQVWYLRDVNTVEWKVAEVYDACFRFGVPIFVMISGALFLERKVDIRRLYSHNILRMLLVYLIWSAGYGVFENRARLGSMGVKELVKAMLEGRYHLWFLPMLIGIYIILPIIKSFVDNAGKEGIQYFIAVFIVLKIGIFTLQAFSESYIVDYISAFFDRNELGIVMGYTGYFVMGYYVAHYGISNILKKILYILFLPALVCNVALDMYLSIKTGVAQGKLFDSFGIFTFIIVVALFTFFSERKNMNCSKAMTRVVTEVSKCTFGIYLIHLGIMEYLLSLNIHSLSINPILGVPFLSIGVFLIGLFITMLIRRIPVIRRLV